LGYVPAGKPSEFGHPMALEGIPWVRNVLERPPGGYRSIETAPGAFWPGQ
jgi:hypothetical protein